MTDVIVCDPDQKNMGLIKKDCFDYCFEKNFDMEVYGFSNVEQAGDFIQERDVKMTCMLACGTPIDLLINEVRGKNQGNYVVLIAENLAEIVSYMTPAVRPAGCLIKPVKKQDVCSVIDAIEQDLQQDNQETDIFQFKIRSKEYYIECSRILMFEAVSKKVVLYTAAQEYEFYDSFNHILENLPDYFMRSHKSYIVNLRKIQQVDYKNMEIFLEENLIADMSRTVKADMAEKLSICKGA